MTLRWVWSAGLVALATGAVSAALSVPSPGSARGHRAPAATAVEVGDAASEIADDGPAASSVTQATGAEALLRGVAGTPAVACELVVRSLGNRWGSSSVTPRVHPPLANSPSEREIAAWAWTGRPGGGDAPALLAGLETDDPCVRRVAARLLGLVDDPETLSALVARATSGSGAARLAAIAALARGPKERVASRTLSALLDDGEVGVRRAAAWALAESGDDDAVAALGTALSDGDLALRENAAWALGRIESREAVEPLEAALDDSEAGVRMNAAWALGSIEDAAAIPALASLLAADTDVEVRHAAAWALGRIER